MSPLNPIEQKNKRLLKAMLENNHTMRTLAEEANCSYQQIYRIVNQYNNPRPALAKRIADTLKTTPPKLGFE
jgi:transcriptional regulator with XRE-family HTH domain